MTTSELDKLEPSAFVTQLEAIFEQSPWVAERVVNARPFVSRTELHAAMCAAMWSAPRERQLELICAHPELAARATMTQDSVAEQRGAGLDRLTAEEHAALLRLNRAYRERFGFPFILAVKGKDKNDIRASLEARVGNDPETEFQTALGEIEKIAGFRLEALISD
jgi:2-oxo-4-hydroxy-4-carboxy-5-ureidoimidazoline decarboxylase